MRRRPVVVPVWLHPQGDDLMLDVVVSVRASRTRVMGVHDNRLKLQLAAPPADGQANDALVRFLAEALQVARAQIESPQEPLASAKLCASHRCLWPGHC